MCSHLIAYYIEKMASMEFIEALFLKYGIRYRKSYNYKKCKEIFLKSGVGINDDDFTKMCREWWQPSPIDYHKQNLSSGILSGHSWHKAMPSMLHYSLQDKVRECISRTGSIEDLLNIAQDIMKHEYFMVATHDICESLIIRDIPDTLPPSRKKSVSDFVFNGVPYDLKVSTYPDGWDKQPCQSNDDKIQLAQILVGGADTLRVRQEAEGTLKGWGDNRFYIVVANQDRWITETCILLDDIMQKVLTLGNPLKVSIGKESILVHIVEV